MRCLKRFKTRLNTYDAGCRNIEDNRLVLREVGDVELLDEETLGGCTIGHRRGDCERG